MSKLEQFQQMLDSAAQEQHPTGPEKVPDMDGTYPLCKPKIGDVICERCGNAIPGGLLTSAPVELTPCPAIPRHKRWSIKR